MIAKMRKTKSRIIYDGETEDDDYANASVKESITPVQKSIQTRNGRSVHKVSKKNHID